MSDLSCGTRMWTQSYMQSHGKKICGFDFSGHIAHVCDGV